MNDRDLGLDHLACHMEYQSRLTYLFGLVTSYC
jgi:hypothetical protein